MSFGLRDVLDKNVLHQLQLGIWGLSYIYTTAMMAIGLTRRFSGRKPARRWPLQYSLLNTAATTHILAMLAIDGSFDYELLASGYSDETIKQSWIYYRTVLTNPIVNVSALTCFIVICVLPAVLRYDVQCWGYLQGMIGTFFYVGVIGRAYLNILQADQIEARTFENWHYIVISRWIMAVCGFFNLKGSILLVSRADTLLSSPPSGEPHTTLGTSHED